MVQIKVATDQGIIPVELGDATPDETVLKNITQGLLKDGYTFNLATPENQGKSPESPDMSNMTLDEIRDYARARRAQGLDPSTGEPLTEEEYVSNYKEPGVDYRTGVDSVGGFSRFQFGRMDTKEEKQNYLNTVVGSDGFRTDPLGRLILTKTGRDKLGLEEGRELAIDEEGLSFSDIKDFAGESGAPILAATGASIAASGIGFIPGMALVGLSAVGGKVLDEYIEEKEGLQKQSLEEIRNDSLREGAFAVFGEGLGRGISKLFGRLIKGPGGEANEALREQARSVLAKGFRPTVAGATNESFRPVLNRLQAVYEGVFPNAAAAKTNLQAVLKEMKSTGLVGDNSIKNLDEIVTKDINKFYSTADQELLKATRKMDKTVVKELNNIMKNLQDGKSVPKDLNEMIRMRKKVFDLDVNNLYGKVDEVLEGAKIIPTAGIKEAFKDLKKRSIADIESTKFAKKIKKLSKNPYATAREVGIIRSGLMNATRDKNLVADATVGELSSLKKSIDSAFEQARLDLATQNTGGINVPKRFGEALSLLDRTNKLYRKGIKRFDNVVVQDIIRQTQKGQMNLKFVFDEIIETDNIEGFDQLMKSIRGVDTGKALRGAGIADVDATVDILNKTRYGGGTLKEAFDRVQGLPKENLERRNVMRAVKKAEEEAAEITKIRGSGAEMAEQVREGLAKEYLKRAVANSKQIDKATGEEIIDPIKFVANVRDKGSIVNKLFSRKVDKTFPSFVGSNVRPGVPRFDPMKELNDVLTVLEKGKANLAPGVVKGILNKPLGAALKDFQAAQATRASLESNVVLKTLQSTTDPEVIANTVFKNPGSIKAAEKFLKGKTSVLSGKNVPTMDLVRDAAMGKILKQIGATVDDVGEVQLTDNFVDAFKSGRLGSKFQSVLGSYGDETLTSMFGKETAKGLKELSSTMIKASDSSIAGKGGLAAPQIALGFTLGNLLFSGNFISLLGTGAAFKFMSTALRSPKVLKMIMASRRPNSVKQFLSGKLKSDDPLAQGFQVVQQLIAQAETQAVRGLSEQTAEEAAPAIEQAKPEIQKTMQQIAPLGKQIRQQLPNIQPPSSASSASAVSPMSLNPIVTPDPRDRALAEQLMNRPR